MSKILFCNQAEIGRIGESNPARIQGNNNDFKHIRDFALFALFRTFRSFRFRSFLICVDEKMENSIGVRLREWRHALGLTQAQLAERIGVHIGVLKKYEQGYNVPGGEALAAISRTGANMTWLLTGEGQMLPERPQTQQTRGSQGDVLSRRLSKIAELLGDMPEQDAATLLTEFLSRAEETAERRELKRAIAELREAQKKPQK